jgi:hypothetical protein
MDTLNSLRESPQISAGMRREKETIFHPWQLSSLFGGNSASDFGRSEHPLIRSMCQPMHLLSFAYEDNESSEGKERPKISARCKSCSMQQHSVMVNKV